MAEPEVVQQVPLSLLTDSAMASAADTCGSAVPSALEWGVNGLESESGMTRL